MLDLAQLARDTGLALADADQRGAAGAATFLRTQMPAILAALRQGQREAPADCRECGPITSDTTMSERVGYGQKAVEAVIFWAVPLLGGAGLWLIKASGQIPAGAHP